MVHCRMPARLTACHLQLPVPFSPCLLQAQHIPVIRKLVSAGGRVNVKDKKDGKTPLHYSVMESRSAVVGALLEGGGDWTVPDVNGNTPFSIAQKERNFDILKLFGKFEADRSKRGDPPFGSDATGAAPPGAKQSSGSAGAGAGASAASAEEEDGDADLPQVVRVARLMHEGTQYLVDKGNGVLYSNDMEDPEVVGSWSAEGGVVVAPPGGNDGEEVAAEGAEGDAALGTKDEL